MNSANATRQTEPVDERRKGLLESAERLGGIGSWEWRPTVGELLWSDNLYRIFGLEPGQLVPSIQYLLEHTHPDDCELVADRVERLARGEPQGPVDYRILRPDGSIRQLRSIIAHVDPDPTPTATLVGFVQDVTEQRRAERVIRAHVAVSEGLFEGDESEPSAQRLMRKLGEAIGSVAGFLWVPGEDALTALASWGATGVDVSELEAVSSRSRIPRGAGLVGRVWESRQPMRLIGRLDDPDPERCEAAERAGLRDPVGIPAVDRDEVLAVLEFHYLDSPQFSERMMHSLLGIGCELGTFLSRRRGELAKAVLTPRELEVLQLAAFGESTRQIAERLVLSPATVKTHFENIYARLGAADRAAAVAEAVRLGLVK